MNLSRCRQLHRGPLGGTWIRALHPRHAANPLNVAHTPTHASRFNPGTVADPAFEILYLAQDATVALFDAQALLGSLPPRVGEGTGSGRLVLTLRRSPLLGFPVPNLTAEVRRSASFDRQEPFSKRVGNARPAARHTLGHLVMVVVQSAFDQVKDHPA
jgi:hypothetical protein